VAQGPGRRAGAFDGFAAAAALLGLVFAIASVVLVLSPAAVVTAAGRDAVGQEREPCVVDRAEDVVVGGRCPAGDPAIRRAGDFLGILGPAGIAPRYL
jgi:hypothetical protein